MKTIALYDIIGIQEFVFASNKVKENAGASIIVQKVFEDYLREEIKTLRSSRVEWKKYSDFEIIRKPEITAEIIYTGGGNAMVAYHNKAIALDVTRRLSHKIFTKTEGTLKFAVAFVDTEFTDYQSDRHKLIMELTVNKYKMVHQPPLLGIAITREGLTDGLPAAHKGEDKNEYISKQAYFKRNIFEENKKYKNPNTDDYDFPLEFDDLGQQTGQNHIAVVHIDGNNMGKMLEYFLEPTQTAGYEESIQIVREFSKQVDEKFKSVMKKIVQKLADGLKYDAFFRKFKPPVKEKKQLLPIRPIVLNGDDVTFVCNGKIGIPLAEQFLRELNDNSELNINGRAKNISASAGIAIVKSHFPFYRAYQLAEELCNSAKLKGKILSENNGRKEMGNWIDFHIVQTGITTNLEAIRERFYQVPDMESPDPIESEGHGDIRMELKQYNLLWRPWCVAGNCDEKYNWQNLKNIYSKFEIEWKHSRLKKLENKITTSKKDMENYIMECKSRGFGLPEFPGGHDHFIEEQTPYFDALELLDFYVPIPQNVEEIKS